jgi:1L-myo-inositol 1-phosphate cytidylyltransferase / CDP-L-myo-inositol myo-inositolphosphotransferase
MALIGLLTLSHPRQDLSEEPQASIRVAGQSLLERNLSLLRRAGVKRTIVLAELSSPSIEQCLQACADQGLDIVETAADIAAVLNDDDRVLLIEEGVLIDERLVLAMARATNQPVIAIWPPPPDGPADAIRLDANHGFASVLLMSGHAVRVLVRGLGEWDLEQSALRVALNDEHRILMHPTDAISADANTVFLWKRLQAFSDQLDAEALLLARRPRTPQSWPVTWIYDPVASLILRWAWQRRMTAWLAPVLALLLGIAAGVAFAANFPAVGCLLGIGYGLAERLTELATQARGIIRQWARFQRGVLIWLPLEWLAAIGFAAHKNAAPIWPVLIMAALLLLLWRLVVLYQSVTGQHFGGAVRLDQRLVLAAPTRDTLCWIGLVAAGLGFWQQALVGVVVYLLAAVFLTAERVRVGLKPPTV